MGEYNGLVSADIKSVRNAISNYKRITQEALEKQEVLTEKSKLDVRDVKFLLFFKKKKSVYDMVVESKLYDWESNYSYLEFYYPESFSSLEKIALYNGNEGMRDLEEMVNVKSHDGQIYLSPSQAAKVNKFK